MRHIFYLFVILGVALIPNSFAQNNTLGPDEITAATGAGVTAFSSMLSRADVALARSIVSGTTAIKGNVGESVVANSYLSRHLADNGNWVSIRTGSLTFEGNRKGIDVLYLKVDSNGVPCSLMPSEVKYNTSPLGHRLDGIQGGMKWNAPRLRGLGNRYLRMANVTQRATMPEINSANVLPVQLKNGKIINFWRKDGQWYVDCSPSELAEAQRVATSYGTYLNAAGEGKITYRSRLFQIKPQGSDLTIVIKDATNLDEIGSASKLPITGEIKLKGALSNRLPDDIHQDIAKSLKKKLPYWSDKDIDKLAKDMTDEVTMGQALKPYNIWKDIAKNAGIAAVAAIAIDAGVQLVFERDVDWGKTALTGGVAFPSTVAAQGINLALMRSQWMAQLGSRLNCSTQLLSSMTSSAAGGVIFSLAYAFGGWYMGYMDATTARRSAIAGSSGAVAGAAAGAGILALVSAYGTASTGTAIASLSGAAATNASLAALGGGAVSAGGGGMALGAAALGGIITVAAVGVTAAVLFSYQVYDAKQETKRITGVCKTIDNSSFWEASWNNAQAARLIPSM